MKEKDLKKIFLNSWETDEYYSRFSNSNDLNVGRSKKFHTFFVKMDPKEVIASGKETNNK